MDRFIDRQNAERYRNASSRRGPQLTHSDALQIVVEAARAYAEIAANQENNAHKEAATEIWQAIETLQTPPLFQPTFNSVSADQPKVRHMGPARHELRPAAFSDNNRA